jgi:general secretion pathway protein I
VAPFICAEYRRWRRRGFTLLEVLVALVIIGVALAAAMRGALSLTTAAEDTRYTMLATMVAENRLLELRLARGRLDVGQASTPCAQADVEFECLQTVKSTPNPYFRRVELQVFRVTGDGRRRHAEMMAVLPVSG